MPELFNLGDLRDPATPDAKLALIDCRDWDNPRTYSHGEFEGQVSACARALSGRGLVRGDRVAILSVNRTEVLVSYFAIMRAGFVAVPVNVKFPRETIAFLLEDSRIKLAFCDAACRTLLPADMLVVDFDRSNDGGFAHFLDPGSFETVRPAADETAMILYTSGSTGRPKGVPLSHEGQLWAVRTRVGAGGHGHHRMLVAAPLFHMNGLGTVKFAIATGASIVLQSQFNARHYVEAIGRFKVTRLTSVPTMLALAMREHEALAKTDLSSVQVVASASSPITQALIDEVRGVFPKSSFLLGYGTTEAGPVMFGPRPGMTKPDLSLGWPLSGVEVRLVGPDGREVQGAADGELWIRTPANMTGYLNLPTKSQEVLTAEGWYRSRDIFRRDVTGAYTFVGRTDDMFVCGGENIYPGEVESMLERHDDIVQACVVPLPDDIKGQKPYAFVVLREKASLSEDEVKRFALDSAPAYQHPRGVAFLSELPLATTNKVDRNLLSRIAHERWAAPEILEPARTSERTAP